MQAQQVLEYRGVRAGVDYDATGTYVLARIECRNVHTAARLREQFPPRAVAADHGTAFDRHVRAPGGRPMLRPMYMDVDGRYLEVLFTGLCDGHATRGKLPGTSPVTLDSAAMEVLGLIDKLRLYQYSCHTWPLLPTSPTTYASMRPV